MFKFITGKLSVEVVLLILMIGVTPAVVVGFLSVRKAHETIHDQWNRELSRISDTARNTAHNYFQNTGRLGQLIAQNAMAMSPWILAPDLETRGNQFADQSMYTSYIREALERFIMEAQGLGFDEIHIIRAGPNPEIIYPNTAKAVNDSKDSLSFLLFTSTSLALESGSPRWSEKAGAKNQFMLSIPIQDETTGANLGVVIMETGPDKLLEALGGIEPPGGAGGLLIKGRHLEFIIPGASTSLPGDYESLLFDYASGLDLKGKPGGVQELKTPTGAPIGVAWTNLDRSAPREVLNAPDLKVVVFSDKTANLERLGDITAVMIIAGAFVCAAMCGLGYLFVRPMVRPIQSVAAIADNISRDDYSNIDIDSKRPDEIGVMTRAFKLMVENLRNQRKSTLEGVSVLATSASEITSTATQLSASTTRTSSAVSETTATAEEVKQAAMVSSAKAKDVAEKAKEADRTAMSGINAAEDMARRMGLIREQMASINNAIAGLMEHRETILNTTAVVANIAEQSNLLAVNAAIESVRSGEHGHGFGVVAQEIKALADQSKQAANKVNLILRDAGALISAAETASNQTNEAIDAGVRQADTVRDVIRSLSNSVSMAAQDAEVIEASGEQQFVGIDQLAQAMANIDHAMSQSMSGAQQLESEAAKLEELGGRLRELVEFHR